MKIQLPDAYRVYIVRKLPHTSPYTKYIGEYSDIEDAQGLVLRMWNEQGIEAFIEKVYSTATIDDRMLPRR
jgi:hypothetical protein